MKITFLNKIETILTKKDRSYLLFLLIFTIIIAIVETIGISAIMPFLSVANDFSLINEKEYYHFFYIMLSFDTEKDFVLVFGLCILIFYFLRLLLNSLYVYFMMHFINSTYHTIVNKLFHKYLNLTYKKFTNYNSSSLTKVIINEAANITEIFWFLLIMISEVFIFIFIYSILMYIDYKVTISISIMILFIGIFIKLTISKRMGYYGVEREKYQKDFYEILNKSFHNFKMIKLQSKNEQFSAFENASNNYVKTKISSATLQQLPRYIFEYIGFSLIVLIIIYHLINNNENSDLLSLVSVFILGLYRILPSITRIFLSYNTILFQYRSLDIIYNDLLLVTEDIGNEKLIFNNEIKLDNISFGYNDSVNLLSNLNLKINKNDSIAFVGGSGSGKSTLVDIIMGLHKISSGEIYIDEKKLTDSNIQSWRAHFGYIPQSVYLFDGNITQNVTFGLEIDKEKVIEALEKANIWSFLKSKEGLDTIVGESGVMLSGGQKQRVAIARALYKNPDILVLDEATSALDDKTEAKIMDEIYDIAKGKTLIIITHRLSTIRKCNKVYKIENGRLENV